MSNTQGVTADGAYTQTPPALIPIRQSAIPSYTLTGVTGYNGLLAVNIPPLTSFTGFGPDSELIIWASWSCNSSANTKGLYMNIGNPGAPWADTQTTNISNEQCVRISCRNNTASQIVSAQQNLQGSTNAFGNFTLDFTKEQFLLFTGYLANAGDNMRLERYSIWLSNPPTYSSRRLMPGKKMFYGINAHYNDLAAAGGTYTALQTYQAMQQLGCTTIRLNFENPVWASVPTQLPGLISMAQQLNGTGCQMYCLLDVDPTVDGTNLITSEGAAYAKGWQTAMLAINALKPYGVTMYECGNELDQRFGFNIAGKNGYFPSDFDPHLWPIFRGIVGGAIAAVQSQGCLAASPACTVAGSGALDMLWNGTAPDGSSGYTQYRWDITAFHNYQPYGPLVAVEQYPSGPWMNMLEYLNQAYGQPIIISEFNGGAGNTEAQNLTWTNNQMFFLYANRYKWNIAGIMIYEMWEGAPWNQMNSPGNMSVQGTGFAAFVAANPDTGS